MSFRDLSSFFCTFIVLLFHSSSLASSFSSQTRPQNTESPRVLLIAKDTFGFTTTLDNFKSGGADASQTKLFVGGIDVTQKTRFTTLENDSVEVSVKFREVLKAQANLEIKLETTKWGGGIVESKVVADVVTGFEIVSTQIRFAPSELLDSNQLTPYEYQDGLGSIWVFAENQSSRDAQITLRLRAIDEQGELVDFNSVNAVQLSNLPQPYFKNAISGTAIIRNGIAEIPVILRDFSDEEIDIAGFLEESGTKISFVTLGIQSNRLQVQASQSQCDLIKQNKKRAQLFRDASKRLAIAIRAIPQGQALQPSLNIWIEACDKLPPPLIGACMTDLLVFTRLWLESNDPARMQANFETQAAIALSFIETGDLSNDFDLRLSWLTEDVYYQSINKLSMVDFLADAVGTALLAGGTVVGVKVGQAAIAAITRRFPNLAPALLTRLGLPRVKSPGAATPKPSGSAAQTPSRPNTSAPVDVVPGRIDYSGLRFSADDFVYGPSAGGKLREFSVTTGSQRLTALDKPLELDWKQFSQQIMERVLARGNTIRFDLTNMQNIDGVLAGTFQVGATTSFELRFLQANWSRFSGNVKFYRVIDGKMIEVNPPWIK